MKFIKISIVLAIIFSLTGCATSITPFDQRKNLPNDRIYAYNKKTEERTAIITITRDKGMAGCACKIALYINTQLAGRFSTKETSQFYVEPGEVLLKVGQDPYGNGICSWEFGDISSQRETFIKAGENKSYRIRINPYGDMDIQRSD